MSPPSLNQESWFPRPSAPTDIRVVGVGGGLNRSELFRLFVDKGAVEWQDRVGVTGPVDGSAKTTSRLLAVGGWVLKTNVALGGGEEAAVSRAALGAELGSRTVLWHPDKTWGAFRVRDAWYPFSATPELVTLRAAPSIEARFRAWTAMLAMGVDVGARAGIGLDLNPANFGSKAGDSRLYYLDDEWYRELRFAEIASGVVARIPEEPSVDAGQWARWGTVLAGVFQPLCGNSDDLLGLVAAVADHPLAALFEPKRDALRGSLRDALLQASRTRVRQTRARSGAERIAVIADVHGNLGALEAVLRESASMSVDGYMFVGDAVGYGPRPRECVQRLAELQNAWYVRGNHDHAIGTGVFSDGMNRLARSCADWTYEQLSSDERNWLLALPVEVGDRGWLAVHGAPKDPKRFLAYVYELTYQDNLEHLATEDLELCFCGHTHVQFVHERTRSGESRKLGSPSAIAVGGERILLVNPGSVGQPRDHDPRAAFAVWDRRERSVQLCRVAYDVGAVVADLRKCDLPSELGDRLTEGR